MFYMGGKSRFASEMLPTILENRKPDQWYVEPFAGGMNMICNVGGNRIANDLHTPLIEMWKALVNGWEPVHYTEEDYNYIKNNQNDFELYELGWAGFVCAFKGLYFSGYARDYYNESLGRCVDRLSQNYNWILKQVDSMRGVQFSNCNYYDLEIPPNSIVYCDPPYIDTTGYSVGGFDHDKFWDWVRGLDDAGHIVFVSEYVAPDDFHCVWRKEVKNNFGDRSGSSIEKLFKRGEFSWL